VYDLRVVFICAGRNLHGRPTPLLDALDGHAALADDYSDFVVRNRQLDDEWVVQIRPVAATRRAMAMAVAVAAAAVLHHLVLDDVLDALLRLCHTRGATSQENLPCGISCKE